MSSPLCRFIRSILHDPWHRLIVSSITSGSQRSPACCQAITSECLLLNLTGGLPVNTDFSNRSGSLCSCLIPTLMKESHFNSISGGSFQKNSGILCHFNFFCPSCVIWVRFGSSLGHFKQNELLDSICAIFPQLRWAERRASCIDPSTSTRE